MTDVQHGGAQEAEQKNGLGLAGLIVSIVGLLTGGLLSPIALLMCLIAMRRKPRTMAVAGVVISALGTLMLITLVAAIVIGFPRVRERAHTLSTKRTLMEARQAIVMHRMEHSRLPDQGEMDSILTIPDGWGTPIRWSEVDGEIVLRSAGPDIQFETADDITDPR